MDFQGFGSFKKIGKIISLLIALSLLVFAIKEVRDILAQWALKFPIIKEIGLYSLSTVGVLILAIVAGIIYYGSQDN